jgi:hypothetical protein
MRKLRDLMLLYTGAGAGEREGATTLSDPNIPYKRLAEDSIEIRWGRWRPGL